MVVHKNFSLVGVLGLCALLVSGCAGQRELAGDDGSVVIEVEDANDVNDEVGASTSVARPRSTRRVRLSAEEQAELASRGSTPNVVVNARARANYCPELEILNGTGVLTAFIDGGNDTAKDVTHQATITKSGRECKREDGSLIIRVGAAGRAVKGPKSFSNQVALPIRVAVVRNKTEVLFSQIYTQQVNFTSANAQGFSFVEDNVTIPVPEEENIEVLVGFDEKSDPALAAGGAQPSSDDG